MFFGKLGLSFQYYFGIEEKRKINCSFGLRANTLSANTFLHLLQLNNDSGTISNEVRYQNGD